MRGADCAWGPSGILPFDSIAMWLKLPGKVEDLRVALRRRDWLHLRTWLGDLHRFRVHPACAPSCAERLQETGAEVTGQSKTDGSPSSMLTVPAMSRFRRESVRFTRQSKSDGPLVWPSGYLDRAFTQPHPRQADPRSELR